MIKQFLSSDFCLDCRGCCRFAKEYSIWQPHLLKEEQDKLDEKIKLLKDPVEDGLICASLKENDNKCKIYKLRPWECQIYPFLINRKDKKIYLALDSKCPFIQGKLENAEFKKYLQYLSGLLKSPRYTAILKQNPQIIQSYAGVYNLLELKV